MKMLAVTDGGSSNGKSEKIAAPFGLQLVIGKQSRTKLDETGDGLEDGRGTLPECPMDNSRLYSLPTTLHPDKWVPRREWTLKEEGVGTLGVPEGKQGNAGVEGIKGNAGVEGTKDMLGRKGRNPKAMGYRDESQFQRAWMNLNFDRNGLKTMDGLPIRIMNPGRLNRDQGPDFLDAEIMIGGVRHCGHVELHLRQADWITHRHHDDPQYLPVVLHVFLVPGKKQSLRADGIPVPGLCLDGRIRPPVGSLTASQLPCGDFGRMNLPEDTDGWLHAEGMKRMKAKAEGLMHRLKAIHFDWSQLVWEELAATLGGPVNGEQLRTLAQKANWVIVRKYVHSKICMEALLFGQAGMLDGHPQDPYQRELQDNWVYLKAKHGLRQASIPFKFHRMRPAGFPTLRIAHLAMLAEHYRPLCQLLERDAALGFIDSEFEVGDYWAFHYEFGNTFNERRTDFGQDIRHRVAVNVLAPLGILGWREEHVRWDSVEQSSEDWRTAMVGEWLTDLPPECNSITRKFAALGLEPQNALQAQGMLGIYKSDCARLGCLQCKVGSTFLSRSE